MLTGLIKKGMYFDSVTLMNVGRTITEMNGVIDAAVVMGTKENMEILAASGLLAKEFSEASGSDLLIAIKTAGKQLAKTVFQAVETQLENIISKTESTEDFQPGSIEGGLNVAPVPSAHHVGAALVGKKHLGVAIVPGFQPGKQYPNSVVMKRSGVGVAVLGYREEHSAAAIDQ